MIQIKTGHKNFLILALKIIIVCISLWVIYKEVIVRDDFKDTMNSYRILLEEKNTWFILSVLFLMMFLNWLLEAVKWQVLMNQIRKVSLALSLRAIFSGITVSFFTPNRMGEFAGRILHLEANERIKAIIATIVGSMNQLLITIIAGVISLLITLKTVIPDLQFLYVLICGLSVIALAAIVILYFNVSHFYDFLHRIKLFRKIDDYTKVFSFYHSREIRKITLLSLMRYLVFTSQYVVLMHLLDVDIEIQTAYRLIFLIFLVMAMVPSFAIAELSIRGSIALYFMQPLSSNATGIVAASFSLWFINLVIPALIGTFTIFLVRLTKAK